MRSGLKLGISLENKISVNYQKNVTSNNRKFFKINNIKIQMIPFMKIFFESHYLAGFEDLAINKNILNTTIPYEYDRFWPKSI